MARYFFDFLDSGEITTDDEGMDLPSMHRVQEEAVRSLAEMAKDAARKPHGGVDHHMAIEVRDDTGPVLQVNFRVQIDRLRH